VQQYLEKIETLGGAVRCIENGFYHRELSEAAYHYQRQIEQAERVLVGLNAYQDDKAEKIPVFKADPQTESRQVERLQALRQQRDNAHVHQALANLVEAAKVNENLMPTLIQAVKTYATIGEICQALRTVYGTYRPSQVI
jgi:methylmalonyl-CoA mutase N-terminal domain/subunit